jgi:SAM-dependent methyltransferase
VITAYRPRVHALLASLLRAEAPLARVLDFGAGDGWYGERLLRAGLAVEIEAVDVAPRAAPVRPVRLYDGVRLPYDDRSFDLALAVDVLHHCAEPLASLADLARCSARLLLLKDHVHHRRAGALALALLDELGNRRFGIPSPRHYQAAWEWLPAIAALGWRLERLIHPARCHRGPLGWATNHLQFVALWRREGCS